jgi:hypothetical protein
MTDEDDAEDPFDDYGVPEDADPFEDLEAADFGPDEDRQDADQPGSDPAGDTPPGRLPDDPFERHESLEDPDEESADDEPTAADRTGIDDTDGAATEPTDDPFDSLQQPRRGTGEEDPFQAFESVDVEGVDPDHVWERLADAEAEGIPELEDRTFYEVSKHRFCERCEYFTGPPETRCTYEDAAIVEFLDMETVRLVNCPIVAQQRELEASVGDMELE